MLSDLDAEVKNICVKNGYWSSDCCPSCIEDAQMGMPDVPMQTYINY